MLSGFVADSLQRGDRRNFFVSAAYLSIALGLSFALWHTGVSAFLMPGLIVVAIGGFIAWFIAHRRYHLIHDTPTSPVRSASQGYVELVGSAELYPGETTGGLASAPPSVWYTVRISYGEDGRQGSETRRSDDTFLLRDATGVCAIDPDHAEVVSTHRKRWRSGDEYFDYRYLRPGDDLYVLGEFSTARTTDAGIDPRTDAREMLRDWKADPAFMLQHYDANRDGEIDIDEWQSAREDAKKIAAQLAHEHAVVPGFHIVRAPADGRPLLISNRDPENLARHYRYWAWFHLVMFVVSAGFALQWIVTRLA
jgi:hypothetical protein